MDPWTVRELAGVRGLKLVGCVLPPVDLNSESGGLRVTRRQMWTDRRVTTPDGCGFAS
jgi:hypothetical protein